MISVWGPLGRCLSLHPLAWWRCRRAFLGRSSLLARFGWNRRLRRLLSSVRLWFFLLFRGRRTGTSWATCADSLGRWGWSWGRSFSTWLGFTSRRIWPSWRWFSTFRPEKATRLCQMWTIVNDPWVQLQLSDYSTRGYSVRKTARMPVGKSQNNSRGIKNWVNLGFWETDHLPIPYANILP